MPTISVDLNGDTIRFANKTEEHRFKEMTADLRNGSQSFAKLYNELNNSTNIYNVVFGDVQKQTGNSEGGYFNPDNNEIRISPNADPSAFTEEFFHAFQYNNLGEYDIEKLNLELEAKVFNSFALHEASIGYILLEPISELQENILYDKYSEGVHILSGVHSMLSQFLKDYKAAASVYGDWNTKNNHGNFAYRKATSIEPYNLLKLLLPL